jgi:hypothetical protein
MCRPIVRYSMHKVAQIELKTYICTLIIRRSSNISSSSSINQPQLTTALVTRAARGYPVNRLTEKRRLTGY